MTDTATSPKEFTLEQFRAVATCSIDHNCRGYLSGGRTITGRRVTWRSASGEHHLNSDLEDPDPVKSTFEELQKYCFIRDCLVPATEET